MTTNPRKASEDAAEHEHHHAGGDHHKPTDAHAASHALHKLIGEVGLSSSASVDHFTAHGQHSHDANGAEHSLTPQLHPSEESASFQRLTGDIFPNVSITDRKKPTNDPESEKQKHASQEAARQERTDLGADVHLLLGKTASDKAGGNANLVDYLSTLNSKQVGQMEGEYKNQYGQSFTESIEKTHHGSVSQSTREALPYLMKGSDQRTAADNVALAHVAAKTGGEDGKRLLAVALQAGSPTADEARQQLQSDDQFLEQVHNKWSSGLDAREVKDYVHQGYISLTTIAQGDKNNKANLSVAIGTASATEREEYAIGNDLHGKQIKPQNAMEQQALDYYNQLHGDFEQDGSKKNVATWEKELIDGGMPTKKGKPGSVGVPAGSSAQHDLALQLSKGAYDGAVEDASAATADRAMDQYVSALSDANAVSKKLPDSMTQHLNALVTASNQGYQQARQKYNSDNTPWWKTALSIAGDVAIGAAGILLAPETGGSSVAFAAGLLADGAAMTLMQGAKTEALGGHYNWSPGSLIKSTIIGAASVGIGKFVLPAVISRFGASAAADTTEQIASTLESNPATSALDEQAQQTITDRLAPTLAKANISGRVTEPQLEGVLEGIVPKGSEEYKQILPILEENTAEHVVTPSEVSTASSRIASEARVRATDLGINATAGLTIKALVSPIDGHLDTQDVQSALVGKGTITPVASMAKTLATEATATSSSAAGADGELFDGG